ncbi:TPA: ABC transporter ATP-binding protein, partial [Streptococcus pyogenes]|nr:ABC transporter ATP-binding protein [Streptococcus pyogenes]
DDSERKQQEEFYNTTIITNKNGLFINLLNSILDLIVWLIGGASVIKGFLTLGELFAFSSYSARVANPFKNVANISYKAKEVSVSLDRIREILDSYIDEEEYMELAEIKDINSLSFNIRNLRYKKNESIINELDVSLKKGESLFIQGESGSGKSTILNTIFKGEPLYEGSIKINGLDIDKISRLSILKNLAYLSQSNLIFKEESLKNNIVMGNKFDSFDYCDILQGCNLKAIEQRGLNKLSDISDLLSEGEKQRVCIARTLYQHKSLIIFDEFASNIDINMAKKILSYIINKNKESITIIVSHRVELSDMCTKTIVIDECKGVSLHD